MILIWDTFLVQEAKLCGVRGEGQSLPLPSARMDYFGKKKKKSCDIYNNLSHELYTLICKINHKREQESQNYNP